MSEKSVVYDGSCKLTLTNPNGTKEEFGRSIRTVTVEQGTTVIRNHSTGVITVVPAGASVKIEK